MVITTEIFGRFAGLYRRVGNNPAGWPGWQLSLEMLLATTFFSVLLPLPKALLKGQWGLTIVPKRLQAKITSCFANI